MHRLTAAYAPAPSRPVKVLQFGEGNFLRAFVDYFIDIANEQAGFDGSVAVVKPIAAGSLQHLTEQDCRYTVLLRGLVDGTPVEKSRLITSVSDAVDCYSQYDAYAAYARCESLRFIVSNTTEAGIVLQADDDFSACPPVSFPSKLCKFLYERAVHFDYAPDKGLVMLPVELIDDNGIALKRCVKAMAEIWQLGERFLTWLDTACVFTSTLVDRIVTGYPRDEVDALWAKLGYEDRALVTAEPFGLWVIESAHDLSHELPLEKIGLPVLFTDNQKPYKQRKVRILNGAHTSFVPAAFQCGHNIVLEAMNDDLIRRFMHDTLHEEVIPTLSLPREDLLAFADAVTGRFRNPYIKHALLAICLNSVSKWRARCMPSLLGYVEKTGCLPARLTFSLASLMSLYRGGTLVDGLLHCRRGEETYTLQDDAAVLSFFAQEMPVAEQVRAFLTNEAFFGAELGQVPGLIEAVTEALNDILAKGMRTAMEERFGR